MFVDGLRREIVAPQMTQFGVEAVKQTPDQTTADLEIQIYVCRVGPLHS